MDKIQYIKELIKATPEGNQGKINNDILELDVSPGIGFSFGLWKEPEIAVARTVVSKGAVFMPHHHKQIEIITVYKGSIELYVGAESIEDVKEIEAEVLKAGDIYKIDADVPHVGIAIEDCYMTVQSIPASKFFPDAHK